MIRILYDFKTARGAVKMVKLDNGEVWDLKGECSRCGECCENLKMPLKEIAGENGKCIKLEYETQNGEKMAKCTAPYETRPNFCALYPRDPYEKLYENCTFAWVRLNG